MSLTYWCCGEPAKVGPTGYPTCKRCRKLYGVPVVHNDVPCKPVGCPKGKDERDSQHLAGCDKCKPFAYQI